MDYDDEGSEEAFNTSEVDWGDEPDQNYWEEETERETYPCCEQTDSEISIEEAHERYEEECQGSEPWSGHKYSISKFEVESDHYQGVPTCYTGEDESWRKDIGSHTNSGDEQRHEQGDHKGEWWCEETDAKISGEDDHGETDSEVSFDKEVEAEPCYSGFISHQVQTHHKSTVLRSRANMGCGYTSNSLIFSGSSKDPEAYLRWETNMKQWMRSHNIPKGNKLSYVVNTLIGDVYTWWLKEDAQTFYRKPKRDWRDLKARMYREFVKKHQTSRNITTKPMYPTTPKKVMSMQTPQPILKHKSAYHAEPKRVFLNTVMIKKARAEQSTSAKMFQQSSTETPLFQPQVVHATSNLRRDASWPSKGVDIEHKKSPVTSKTAKERPQATAHNPTPSSTSLLESQGKHQG